MGFIFQALRSNVLIMGLLKKTFKRGGIKLPEHKETSKHRKIANAPIPKKVRIPMLQHLGKPAIPCVEVGDIVEEGTLIGVKDGDFSAHVHASIPGKVTALGVDFTPTGQKSRFVEIQFSGSFKNWEKKNPHWERMPNPNLLNLIEKAGVVGLGGATFPTHIKLNPNKRINHLVINGAECEPFLTIDGRLMQEKAEELKEAIKIYKKILNPRSIIVGIEDNKEKAIEMLQRVAKNSFEVMPLKSRYPQGSEKQLIEVALGFEIPKGKLPFEVGVVVSNVGTLFAVYEAIVYEKPLYERLITVSGQIIKWPGNYKVRLGTLIEDLLVECKIFTEPKKIVVGGPMMGVAQQSLQTPLTKGSTGVIVFSKEEIKAKKEHPCIRCGRCMGVCPMGLFPNKMFSAIQANHLEKSEEIGLMDCIECAACSFICPSRIPLVNYFKSAKINLKAKRVLYLNRTPLVRGWKYEKDTK